MYQITRNYIGPDSTREKPDVKLVGVKKASTFTGFCAKHDQEIFRPLETLPFECSILQCFLLGYRAIAKEYYEKKALVESYQIFREMDRGLEQVDQFQYQRMLSFQIRAGELGLKEIKFEKEIYDQMLLTKKHNSVFYYALALDRCPDVLCSTYFAPWKDFKDRKLQDPTDFDKTVNSLALSLIPTDEGGAAVFTWVSDSVAVSEFVRSFHQVSQADKPHALRRLVFEVASNVYFAPGWWEGLEVSEQNAVLSQYDAGISKLQDYSDYGLKVVDWKITGCATNAA